MATVPVQGVARIEWYEQHVPVWVTNVTAIGLVTADTTDLTAKTTAARTAYEEQQAAQDVAKAKTLAYRAALTALSVAGSAAIDKIRAKAKQVGGDSVYVLAQIPAPAIPAPPGDPGTPSEFVAELDVTGALNLKWKCTNPTGGTMYQVFRRSTPSGEFDYLGGTGDKKFVDSTIPAGSSQVTYQIQAVRSTAVGAWAQFNVNFGVNGAGTTVTSVVATDAPKIAA
jgi:hypothetical protein